jgi:hypothetical protein
MGFYKGADDGNLAHLCTARYIARWQLMSALGQKRTYAVQKSHVRFTPNSDRESEIPQTVMSALPPKADMCSALIYVCFGPIADIRWTLFD